jgi:hypothetical protein
MDVSVRLSGNEWDCVWDFQFVLKLHERGALVNGDHLMCKDTKSQQGSWIEWNYSIVKRETNKKVQQFCVLVFIDPSTAAVSKSCTYLFSHITLSERAWCKTDNQLSAGQNKSEKK